MAGLAEWLKSPEGKADKIEIQLEDEGKLELLERGLVIQAPGEIVIKGNHKLVLGLTYNGPPPLLKLTDKSLRELGDNNVPEEILVKLNALKDRGYPRQQFFDELKELLNETELGEFQSRIVKEATGSNPYVALTLVSPTTRVEGIRFEIDGNRDNESADDRPAAARRQESHHQGLHVPASGAERRRTEYGRAHNPRNWCPSKPSPATARPTK